MLTLNVTDSAWFTDQPHCGSIGHICDFESSIKYAVEYKFQAVNIDIEYLRNNGIKKTKSLLQSNNIKPAAFPFTVKFHSHYSNYEFQSSLKLFENDCMLCDGVNCKLCVMYVPPSSDTIDFYKNFNIMSSRLKYCREILLKYNIKLGLEFIGTGDSRKQKYDYIHTIDGIRCLIAASDLIDICGFKFDVFHWFCSGSTIEDIEKMNINEILYVELNDAIGGIDYYKQPEFDRRLPQSTNIINCVEFLSVIIKKGYKGPIVCEPWNIDITKMEIKSAITLIKDCLDNIMDKVVNLI